MKRQYTIWHLPLLSFYSKRLYRDISFRWKGTNLGFLCLLLALCLLPTIREANRIIDRHAAIYLMQIPQMQFSNGRVSVDAPQPYSIIDGNRTMLLIDTTGQINTLAAADASALMTATTLYIGQNGKDPLVYDLSAAGEFMLNQEIAAEFLERMKRFLLPAYYVVALLFATVLFLLAALLCGAIALLFGQIQKRQVDYPAGLRLAVTAFTPPLILATLFQAAGLSIPVPLYLLLALAYLYLAVGSCRKAPSNTL
ncbi:MAG: DUF1189 domain-containing protein [Kiritimatiellales bacterium]|nr:DUF1189 domain-containing protein [Kiritimatiellales bacterium]MCF7863465.1 DUF1189 domain-containing protein [Kiritimatiellales bacterium]